jgi:magnesium transporter
VPAAVAVRWCEQGAVKTGGASDLSAARASGPVWVDVLDPDKPALDGLAAEFGLHPLAVEDSLHAPQRQKIDTYGEAAFIVWLMIRHDANADIQTVEMDAFLGNGYLITLHTEPVPAIDDVTATCDDVLCKGADWTLHAILDRAVDDIFPIIDYVSETLDTLEDELLRRPDTEQLHQLYTVKRRLVDLYRAVSGQRDIIRSMARHQEYVSQDAYLYFQDIGDHLARVSDSVDTYRDVASSAMDIYLSSVNNRMNAIMKQLTVVATIFMPLTLISGIYGMNVIKGMWPPVDAQWSFAAVIGSMLVLTVGMLWFFRRRNWW